MTREEARKAAEVMLAYADGKDIDYKNNDSMDNAWIGCDYHFQPAFNWGNNDYRVKKEPTYRPFKDMEECLAEMQKHQPFGWMKYKSGEAFYIVAIGNGNDFIRAYEKLTFADGTPFGMKEE